MGTTDLERFLQRLHTLTDDEREDIAQRRREQDRYMNDSEEGRRPHAIAQLAAFDEIKQASREDLFAKTSPASAAFTMRTAPTTGDPRMVSSPATVAK
jgi:hypothetical protein